MTDPKPVGMMPPTWLDGVIDGVIGKNDPAVIAQAIAASPQFIAAIKKGLANKPAPGVMGPSHSQVIRRELAEAIAAS